MQLQLFEEHALEFERLNAPDKLKIGIQVRTGDSVYDQQPSLEKYLPFFDCATQIEASISAAFEFAAFFTKSTKALSALCLTGHPSM